MLGCLLALWVLFLVGIMFLLVLAAVVEHPQLAVIAAVVLGCWWLARRVGATRAG